jgi:hypothetical protein
MTRFFFMSNFTFTKSHVITSVGHICELFGKHQDFFFLIFAIRIYI